MAWTVAFMRVHEAASRHEVFGFEATLAFVVMVALPIVHARSLGEFVVELARKLSRRREQGRESQLQSVKRTAASAAKS